MAPKELEHCKAAAETQPSASLGTLLTHHWKNHPGEQALVHRHTYNTCQLSEEARTF